MLRPLLVEYTEPGVPLSSHLQQQGNMALFLTLFIVTCVEVLIVKVAQIEVDLGIYLTPHDPPYMSEYSDDEDYDDEDYDICREREVLYEEELLRQKKRLFKNAITIGTGPQDFLETKKTENDLRSTFNENHQQEKCQNFQSKTGPTRNWSENQKEGKDSQNQEASSDTVQVREFIEKMVEALIGGRLDGTTVGQLSNHSAYLGMFTKYHNLLCRELARLGLALHLSVVRNRPLELDSSNFSQCNLKRLINRIVSEAMTLPNIKQILCRPKTVKETVNDDFKDKSYEDILATAILNKVIEHFQNRENETTDNKPKPRPRGKKLIRNLDNDDQKSNSDWSDASRSDKLSLTIEEYIEEVTTALEASEDEISDFSDFETNVNRRIPFPEAGRTVVDGTDDENSDVEGQSSATELFTSTSSWEENWLFQKKRLRSTPNAHHPVPVPMLVPNPSEDYRALVGGVDADDLSDMSDCSDLIGEDLYPEKKPLLQLSNTDFEGFSSNKKFGELNENENRKDKEDGVKEIINDNVLETGTGANLNCSVMNLEEKINTVSEAEDECSEEDMNENVKLNSCVLSPSQKDREFSVEDFDLLQQCESSTLNELSDGVTIASRGSGNCRIKSRVAEKEKEKWNNPVFLVDNPYSLENIEKRAQRRKNDFFQIGTYTRESVDFPEDFSSDELTKPCQNLKFIRDYYINDSKNPSGKSSPSLNQLSKGSDQVSRQSYEALSSLGRRSSEKRSKPTLCLIKKFSNNLQYTTSFEANNLPKNLFSALKTQTMKNQHFSNVFKSNYLTDSSKLKTCGKYHKGSHYSKIRPKPKELLFIHLGQELSDFEQKSLRENTTHTLLRAKDASANFIINPVYTPDVQSAQKEPSIQPWCVSHCDHVYEQRECSKSNKINNSDFDPELEKSEPIVPCYRQTPGPASKNYHKRSRISQESGYGSDSLDYSSDSLEFWRLTPPKTPEETPIKEKIKAFRETETFVMQEKNNETYKTKKINKKEFSLPNVKELAKQFTVQATNETKRMDNDVVKGLEYKRKVLSLDNVTPGRELELDYSTTPVSEIVTNLQQNKHTLLQVYKPMPYEDIQPKTQIEICRKNIYEETKVEKIRFNGKQVHSLTARSISKEFREGLKNNSYQNVFLKINRAVINGENEQRDIVYGEEQISPTPPIDLKNIKKFWEELIMANANTTKQK